MNTKEKTLIELLLDVEEFNAIARRTPRVVELEAIGKRRYVALGSTVTNTVGMDGSVYEKAGDTFVRVSKRGRVAAERTARKSSESCAFAYHCPGWIGLDASVNELTEFVQKTVTKWFASKLTISRVLGLRFLNMDIVITRIFEGLARHKPVADIVDAVWPMLERSMKHEAMTGHDLIEIQGAIIEIIGRIEVAYKQELATRSTSPFRKKRGHKWW